MKAGNPSRWWLRLAIAAIVIASSAFAYRALRHSKGAADLPTAVARSGEFSVLVQCRGDLTAARSIQLSAPLGVQDLQIVWLAPVGSSVKEGDVVIRFDPSKLQQDLKEKKAALDQAQATLDQAVSQARITADQDNLDLSKAESDREKAKLDASKSAVVSVMEGQKSAIDLTVAVEKVKVQQATIELHKKSGEAKIASQQRLRDEAKAEVVRTEQHLGSMALKSPLNGVITYLMNQSQGWMNAQPYKVGDHVSAGLAIAEIPDLSTLQMESKVEEVDRGRVAVGDDVLVHVDAFPEKVMHAEVVTISPLTEQSFAEWPPTRSFKANAQIKNPDPRLRPGMNAGADIVETRIPQTIRIPAKALFAFHGKPVVYVKRQDAWVAVPVTVRARNTDEVALASGIGAGTVVALTEPPRGES